MRRASARTYLKEVHDIDMEEKTLANRNARGLGPRPQYLGTIPYYTAETLDAWAETAFTDASPVAVTRRRARELLAEAEERAVRVGTQPQVVPHPGETPDAYHSLKGSCSGLAEADLEIGDPQ
jgi:hypothetical protein